MTKQVMSLREKKKIWHISSFVYTCYIKIESTVRILMYGNRSSIEQRGTRETQRGGSRDDRSKNQTPISCSQRRVSRRCNIRILYNSTTGQHHYGRRVFDARKITSVFLSGRGDHPLSDESTSDYYEVYVK